MHCSTNVHEITYLILIVNYLTHTYVKSLVCLAHIQNGLCGTVMSNILQVVLTDIMYNNRLGLV